MVKRPNNSGTILPSLFGRAGPLPQHLVAPVIFERTPTNG